MKVLHLLEINFVYLQTSNTYCTIYEMIKYLHIISYTMQVLHCLNLYGSYRIKIFCKSCTEI